MDTWNPHNIIALPEDCCSGLCGIAFDGCFFYLAAPQKSRVFKLRRDFTVAGSIRTCRPYHCICYDGREHCFWAMERERHDLIYRLNRDMKEIDVLRINGCPKTCSSVMSLSCDCEKGTLLAAYNEHIVEISKKSGRARVLREAREGFYAAVLSIAPYYAIVRQGERGRQSFQIYTRDGRCVRNFPIPAPYHVADILLYPCNECRPDEIEFMLLARKDNCDQYVLIRLNICDMILSGCNYEVCHAHCGGDDENARCICDVMKSIALVETSLSHILDAESKKLQKAVELAHCVDELLAIDKSVSKTIINIAQLEYHLYLKLDAINGKCGKPICPNDKMK